MIGSLWACGSNSSGQLADGTNWNSAIPFMVAGPRDEGATNMLPVEFGINTEDVPIYNLVGQKLVVARKGINIIRGKKIIVKSLK